MIDQSNSQLVSCEGWQAQLGVILGTSDEHAQPKKHKSIKARVA